MRTRVCRTAACVIFALAVASAASPQAAATGAKPPAVPHANAKSASELIFESNFLEHVDAWKRMLSNQQDFSKCGCAGSKEVLEQLQSGWKVAVAEEFDNAEMVADIESLTAQSLSAAEIKALLAFRKTSLGVKLSAGERAHNQINRDGNQLAAMRRLQVTQRALDADQQRRGLISKIAEAQGGARALSDTLINLSIGTAIGTMAAQPDGQPRLSDDEVISQVEAMRAPMERQIAPVIVPIYAQIYDAMSRAELQAYLKELRSDLGRKWTDVQLKAFNASLRVQAIKIGKRLARELAAQKI